MGTVSLENSNKKRSGHESGVVRIVVRGGDECMGVE